LAQSPLPIGGRLSKYWEEWDKIGADNWVLKTLKEGYRIPFSPLLTITPVTRIHYMQDPVRRKFLELAVKEMEEKAAIEIVSSPDPGFYSRIFLVPKPGNKWRPIRSLGSQLPHTVPNLQDGDPRVYPQDLSLDLKDTYFHVPIHPESRRYLRFLHQGGVWQFKACPSG
jgi:hypothetical protein